MRGLAERRWGADEARRVLAAWRRSGLSMNAFAREHGFVAQRIGWWRQRVAAGGAELPRFVPVVVRPTADMASTNVAVVLRSPRGTAVEVLDAQAVSPEWLSQLVNSLS